MRRAALIVMGVALTLVIVLGTGCASNYAVKYPEMYMTPVSLSTFVLTSKDAVKANHPEYEPIGTVSATKVKFPTFALGELPKSVPATVEEALQSQIVKDAERIGGNAITDLQVSMVPYGIFIQFLGGFPVPGITGSGNAIPLVVIGVSVTASGQVVKW